MQPTGESSNYSGRQPSCLASAKGAGVETGEKIQVVTDSRACRANEALGQHHALTYTTSAREGSRVD